MTETTRQGVTPHEPLTVGQVAQAFGVTRRTLHHYDEIGLVVPSERTHAGYRLYTELDLTRLQHVVVYRRLGFALEAVSYTHLDVYKRQAQARPQPISVVPTNPTINVRPARR